MSDYMLNESAVSKCTPKFYQTGDINPGANDGMSRKKLKYFFGFNVTFRKIMLLE